MIYCLLKFLCDHGEKIEVMDTADRRVTKQWFVNLDKAIQGRKPDYLVASHLEPQILLRAKANTKLPQFFMAPMVHCVA